MTPDQWKALVVQHKGIAGQTALTSNVPDANGQMHQQPNGTVRYVFNDNTWIEINANSAPPGAGSDDIGVVNQGTAMKPAAPTKTAATRDPWTIAYDGAGQPYKLNRDTGEISLGVTDSNGNPLPNKPVKPPANTYLTDGTGGKWLVDPSDPTKMTQVLPGKPEVDVNGQPVAAYNAETARKREEDLATYREAAAAAAKQKADAVTTTADAATANAATAAKNATTRTAAQQATADAAAQRNLTAAQLAQWKMGQPVTKMVNGRLVQFDADTGTWGVAPGTTAVDPKALAGIFGSGADQSVPGSIQDAIDQARNQFAQVTDTIAQAVASGELDIPGAVSATNIAHQRLSDQILITTQQITAQENDRAYATKLAEAGANAAINALPNMAPTGTGAALGNLWAAASAGKPIGDAIKAIPSGGMPFNPSTLPYQLASTILKGISPAAAQAHAAMTATNGANAAAPAAQPGFTVTPQPGATTYLPPNNETAVWNKGPVAPYAPTYGAQAAGATNVPPVNPNGFVAPTGPMLAVPGAR